MNSSISRHLPVITNRVEFDFATNAEPLPEITPRMDFGIDCQQWLDGGNAADVEWNDGMLIHPRNQASADAVSAETQLTEPESSDAGDDGEDVPNEESDKIPKPRGEPGRPGSGGYNIDSALTGWTAEMISDVKNYIKDNAGHALDEKKSYGKQKPAQVLQFCISVSD